MDLRVHSIDGQSTVPQLRSFLQKTRAILNDAPKQVLMWAQNAEKNHVVELKSGWIKHGVELTIWQAGT